MRGVLLTAVVLGIGECARAMFNVGLQALTREKYRSKYQDAQPVTAHTKYGDIVGINDGNTSQYLGVPFAAPPTGDFRWKAPQPLQPWSSPRNTTWFGPACVQAETYWGLFTGISEDCLYMHIYVPSRKAPPPGGWPMMLFWYGGSWEYGASGFPLYDADFDVVEMEDVIIATSNYRLNAFGFLAGDDLLAESTDGSVGNYGFQDQRAALKFLVENAAAFGGNSQSVTIFGESAGAGSVSNHLVSPRSAGLFQRAIMESGPIAAWTAQPYNISATRLPQLAARVNCTGTGAVRMACLRNVSSDTIVAEIGHLTQGFIEFSPVIDGVEVVDDPRVLAAAGKIAPGVQVMLGSNADEGTLFNHAKHDLTPAEYPAAVAAVVGASLGPSIVQQYPPDLYPATLPASSAWWTLSHALGDAQMSCASRQTARWLTSPNRQGGPQPTFVYFYTHVLSLLEAVDVFDPLGCCHASELVMIFDFAPGLIGPGEEELAEVFLSYWTRFAIYGDPNGGGHATWPAYGNATADNYAIIDTGAAGVNITASTGIKANMCDFWDAAVIPPSVIFGSP